eukprot:COSAG05_NODE_285_length_12188_cov_539.399537_12_plen_105_part_00
MEYGKLRTIRKGCAGEGILKMDAMTPGSGSACTPVSALHEVPPSDERRNSLQPHPQGRCAFGYSSRMLRITFSLPRLAREGSPNPGPSHASTRQVLLGSCRFAA